MAECFVNHLPITVQRADIFTLFHGLKVSKVFLKSKETQAFAIVTLENEKDLGAALHLDGKFVKGVKISVTKNKRPENAAVTKNIEHDFSDIPHAVSEKSVTIIIQGGPGSGKSSLGAHLCSELGFTHFSAGEFYRVAKELKLPRFVELDSLQSTNRSKWASFLGEFGQRCLEEARRQSGNCCFVLDGIRMTSLRDHCLQEGVIPDLLIQLNCPREVMFSRMMQRKRDGESSMDIEARVSAYISRSQIERKLLDAFEKEKFLTKVIVIDASKSIDEYITENSLLAEVNTLISRKGLVPLKNSIPVVFEDVVSSVCEHL